MRHEERESKSNRFLVLPVPYEKTDITDTEDGSPNIPPQLGILPLRDVVVYPHMVSPLLVARKPSVKLIEDANHGSGLIALVAQRTQDAEYPHPEDLFKVGTVAKVMKVLQFPNNVMQIYVHAIARIRLVEFVESDAPYLVAGIEILNDRGMESDTELEALSRSVEDLLGKITTISEEVPDDLTVMARDMDPSATADMIAM